MFFIRLANLVPLLHATSLFTQITNHVVMKFSPWMVSMHAQHPSHLFKSVIFMPYPFFADYSIDHYFFAGLSLQPFSNVLLEAQMYASMVFHLESLTTLVLTLETAGNMPQLRHELKLFPAEKVNLGQVSDEISFAIDSKDFKSIVTELSVNHNHRVSVAVTSSEVRFSVESEERVFSREEGQCVIVGVGEDEIQLKITLHPSTFFINMANQGDMVWFLRTSDSRCIMSVAFHDCAQFLVYFS